MEDLDYYDYCQTLLDFINLTLVNENRKPVDIGIKQYGNFCYSFILTNEKDENLYEIEEFNPRDLACALRNFFHGLHFAFWGE